MPSDYRPRLAFEITHEQRLRIARLGLHHGQIRAVFSAILDDVLELVEQHGQLAIGAIVSGAADPKAVIKSIKEVQDEVHEV